MHAHIAEKIKYGNGTRVFALLDEGGLLRLTCMGDFDSIRYRFNQMACLIGGVAMEQLLLASGSVRGLGVDPLGTWKDRTTRTHIGPPTYLWDLAARGPSPEADLVGAMVWFGDWPDGLEDIPGTKHLVSSMAEVGGLFYDSRSNPIVRAGRAQERSALKRLEEALVTVKRKGFRIADEDQLLKFMSTCANAKHLQLIHTIDVS